MNFNDVIIVITVKESDCKIHVWYISKDDAINIMKNFDLNEKTGLLWHFFLNIFILMKTTYYQRNREKMLNRAKEYFEDNKERLQEKARNKYRRPSNEEKNI